MATDNCRRDDYPPYPPQKSGRFDDLKQILWMVWFLVLVFGLVMAVPAILGLPLDLGCGGHAC